MSWTDAGTGETKWALVELGIGGTAADLTCKNLIVDTNGEATDLDDGTACSTANIVLPGGITGPFLAPPKLIEMIKAKYNREEALWNTAFAPPAQCPGLFRYGNKLPTFIFI